VQGSKESTVLGELGLAAQARLDVTLNPAVGAVAPVDDRRQ
jgi:hypothetical protein